MSLKIDKKDVAEGLKDGFYTKEYQHLDCNINDSNYSDVSHQEHSTYIHFNDNYDIIKTETFFKGELFIAEETDINGTRNSQIPILVKVELFKEVADKTNRQLVITAKDAHLLYALEVVDTIDHLEDISVYLRPRKKPPYWEEYILQANKEISYVTNDDIKSNPEGYIVCFSSGDIINFLDITPVKGVYIFSSPGAFKIEQEFDFIRLNRWLESYNIKSYGFRIIKEDGRGRPKFIRGFHASGHASESELEWMIDKIDPDIVIPVHTENVEWFTEQYGDKAKILNKGERFTL